MPQFVDLKGRRFGRLVAKKFVGLDSGNRTVWLCLCDCGGKKVARSNNLRNRKTRSCGCLRIELLLTHNFKHRACFTPAYRSWAAMLSRCSNPNATGYSRYGGAGITICDRWRGVHGFEHFLADMGERSEGTTLGRFGDVGPYSPRNCAWMTNAEQGEERKKRNALSKAA